MKTGKGRPGARVLVSDDEGVILDARTGKDGVLVRDWDKPLEPGQGANAAPKAEPVPIPQPAPAQAPTPPPARRMRPGPGGADARRRAGRCRRDGRAR